MRKKPYIISPYHATNFIKLCYILIFVVSVFGLKYQIFPEGEYQLWFSITATEILLENIVWSLVISGTLSFAIFKSF